MNKKLSITAVILTFNEEKHLQRCIDSLKNICEKIIIVDSYSTDETIEIAKLNSIQVFQNKFKNYSTQFNWALQNTNITTDWTIRIDADEYIDNELANSLISDLDSIQQNVCGIKIKRQMYFLEKPLKKGGMYPIWHLRIWRTGKAFCEIRWMDEHMVLTEGLIINFQGNIIDNNVNNITWWTQKHNNYATREAIDVLNAIYNFSNVKVSSSNLFGNSEQRRRWLKLKYLKLPLFVRPFLFFFVRYILQGGFLEGKRGFIWSILQCFWYRFLVDVKIYEVIKYAGTNKDKIIEYFQNVYNIDIRQVS